MGLVVMREMYIIPDKDGRTLLGVSTPLGIFPVVSFSSLEELKRFAMGILGYCEHFHPELPIPDVILEAFKEDNNA